MQKNKNIRLLILLTVSVGLVIMTHFLIQPSNAIDVERDLFAMENTMDINKVVFTGNGEVNLSFENNAWVVNGQYDADPQRINVLFAIIKQISVRRRVSENQLQALDSLFNGSGARVDFYVGADVAKSIEVAGSEEEGLTYARDDNGDIYLVEIPGYRSYLGGIFALDANGWRNPLVFDINWANLSEVIVSYPNSTNNDLHIVFDDRSLTMKDMEADSAKLEEYINDVSLLYVNDYLTPDEVTNDQQIQCVILIKDIAKNTFSVAILNEYDADTYLVQIDSVDYGIIDSQMIRRVTKPKGYFRATSMNQ